MRSRFLDHSSRWTAALILFAAVWLPPPALAQTQAEPPGAEKSAKTKVLETGARLLQRNSPVAALDIYLDGFHPMKGHPEHQMEAHHFCHQVNEDFAQCALFDGNGPDANLNGIEYIISEKLFATLPEAERKYWHPHNGEILSGQLVAPGIPEVAEEALMKRKMNSYGKTWHVWNTGTFGRQGDKLPLGEPMLAWSFNRDGEAQPGLVEQRDRRLKIDSSQKRSERTDLRPLARPQSGGSFAGKPVQSRASWIGMPRRPVQWGRAAADSRRAPTARSILGATPFSRSLVSAHPWC